MKISDKKEIQSKIKAVTEKINQFKEKLQDLEELPNEGDGSKENKITEIKKNISSKENTLKNLQENYHSYKKPNIEPALSTKILSILNLREETKLGAPKNLKNFKLPNGGVKKLHLSLFR